MFTGFTLTYTFGQRPCLLQFLNEQKDQILKDKLPKHVAIIMDGNGRWAKKKGMLRVIGHENGTKSVRDVVEASAEIGIKYLTSMLFLQKIGNVQN